MICGDVSLVRMDEFSECLTLDGRVLRMPIDDGGICSEVEHGIVGGGCPGG